MKHARNILVLSLILLTAVPACAQDYPNGILDRDAVIEAAKSVTAEAYPNADEVLVDDHIIVRYNADGTATRWDDTFVKVLTEAGKRNNQSQSFDFNKHYTRLDVTLVEVIKPDGTVIPVDVAEQGKIMVDPFQMYMNIYDPNQKTYQVGVPGLEVGDLLRYVFVRRTVKARMTDAWHDYELLEQMAPIKRFVYEVLGPKELPLQRIIIKDEIDGTVTATTGEKDGLLHYRWDVRDVPRLFFEPSMPSLLNVAQRLRVSTIPDWQTVSRWYWNLCEPHIKATTPEMEQKVAELVDGLTDRQAKIEAIFYWAAQKVRYMGITTETEAPGYEPHDVSITFGNKYGVCRDKAALLVAMLRLAGLDANMVLIHGGAKRDREAPDPYFNHAIAAVREPDGSFQLMDCTSETTKQLLPSYLSDKNYLVAMKEGEDLATSPIIPAEENLVRIESTGSISATGDLTLRSEIHFDGYEDNYERRYFSSIKPDQRRQYFERVVKECIAGATLTKFELTPQDMQDTTTPMVVRLELKAKDVVVSGDQCSTLRPPFVGGELGMVHYLLYRTGLDKRKYPLQTDIACGVRETLTIELPEALCSDAAMPSFAAIDDPTLSWTKSLELDGSTLRGTNEFLIKVVEFSPDQYLTLKEHLGTIEYNQRKMPIFAASAAAGEGAELIGPEDDYIILDRRVIYEVADAHNWTERRIMKMKILTQAGRESQAELRFDYNPAWGDAKLVKATVTAPDGTVKAVRDEEINVMDAEWVAAAPRYPAGKMLTINLPNVEIGSIIEHEVVLEHRDRPFFHMNEGFRAFDPVVTKVVQVRAPSDLPLTIMPCSAEDLTSARRSEGDTTVYEWAIADQTADKQERQLPPRWSYSPMVFVSAGEWPAYTEQVGAALEAAAGDATRAATKAKELVDGIDNDRARIVAIRDFVARNVRTVGEYEFFEPTLDELPLSAITAADRVLADGYGNASDRAVLLTAMLRAVGFKPQFVLASRSTVMADLNEPLRKSPQTDTFGTVLVRVRLNGEDVYLNDGDQYAALGATSHDQKLGLTVNGGELVTIAATDDRQDRYEQTLHIRLSDSGDAVIEKVLRHHGYMFGWQHRQYAEMPPEQRRRHHLEQIARIAQAAKANGDLMTDFDSYPGAESFRVSVEKFAVRDGDYLYLTLPDDLFSIYLPGTDTRQNPVFWSWHRRSHVRVTVELPKGLSQVLLAPPDIDWEAPAGAGRVTVRTKHEDQPSPRLVIDFNVDLKPAVIDAKHYPKLLEIGRRLSHPSARMIVLRKSKP